VAAMTHWYRKAYKVLNNRHYTRIRKV